MGVDSRDGDAAGKLASWLGIGEREVTQSKLISLKDAVRCYTWDGMQYASGAGLPVGSDAIVFGREVLRQGRKDLHAVFHCNTQQLNLFAAAGALEKSECGFAALEVFGFANGLRRAVESGAWRSRTTRTSQ